MSHQILFLMVASYKDESSILNQVETMLNEGATFIDIGGYSSRPGADHVNETEELNRVIPVIELILKHFPDTLYFYRYV